MFGEGRVAGVVQPLHQIVSRQRFIDDDQENDGVVADDGSEWHGFGTEGDDTAAEVIENDLENPEAGPSSGAASSNEEADDDEELAWEDLVEGGAEAVEQQDEAIGEEAEEEEDDAADDGPSPRKHVKEPRMKTNKKKAENFFTHANVKNKNRNRKIPTDGSRRKKR